MYADSAPSGGTAPAGPGKTDFSWVLVVDDHALLSQSLCQVLRDRGLDVKSLVPCSPGEVLDCSTAWAPDLVLLDLHLGDAGTALPLVHPLSEHGARVVMLTGSANAAEIGPSPRGRRPRRGHQEPAVRRVREGHHRGVSGEAPSSPSGNG